MRRVNKLPYLISNWGQGQISTARPGRNVQLLDSPGREMIQAPGTWQLVEPSCMWRRRFRA